MRLSILLFHILFLSFVTVAYAVDTPSTAITESIASSQLANFRDNPPAVRQLILNALSLSTKHLTYHFGSADPKNKGMDCSGTIYYLLGLSHAMDTPRQSDEQFNWVENEGKLYLVTKKDTDSADFDHLKPGDLLFWSGTYHTNTKRPSGISHVMLYLGKNKHGERLMFGASNGRTYKRKRMRGVSVFDFKLPSGRDTARFVGYGCIPSLTCSLQK